MLSFLTRQAVRRSSITVLLTVAVLVFGTYAATQLKQELAPSVEFPVITIITDYPGAEPQAVADAISAPIEQAVSGLPGLQNVQSTSVDGISIVLASFDYGADLQATQSTLSTNLQAVTLPAGASTPQVQTFNLASLPIMQVSLSSSTESPEQLAQLARTQVLPELKKVDGVFSVDLSGGGARQLVIQLDPTQLTERKISVQQVIGALQANSLTVPGGTVDQQGFSIPVVTTHRFQSVQDICGLVVGAASPVVLPTPTSTPATIPTSTPTPPSAAGLCQSAAEQPGATVLADVATVTQSDTPTDGISRTNGVPSIGLAITKTQDANTVSVSDAVNAKLSSLESNLPSDVTVTVIEDQATFIKQSINDLVDEGLLGAAFAILVIFLFLLNVRSTLVSAISIPISLLIAFIVLYASGISLNVLTLAGLAIAVGRVVDDAIVVLENIYRHVQAGERPRQAVISATREVGTAVTASTATTLAVFVPIAFVGGLVGAFFRPFALAVVAALAASLLVALTLVPVLAQYFVRPGRKVARAVKRGGLPHEDETWLQRIYTPILRTALSHRWITLGIAVVLFAASISTVARIPTSFLSTGAQKMIAITVSPPSGADIQAVSQETAKVEAILHQDNRVQAFQTTIGGSGMSTEVLRSLVTGGNSNSATITAIVQANADLEATANDLRAKLSDPSVADSYRITVQDSVASNNQFQVTLSGSDAQQLTDAGTRVLGIIQHEDHVTNPTSDASAVAPTVFVTVDPARASRFGLTTAQVGEQVRAALAGQTALQVTAADVNDGQPTNVVVQLNAAGLQGSRGVNLANLPIFYGGVGGSGVVPLGQIATIAVQPSQVVVTRVGGQPAITISADISGQNTGQVSADLQNRIAALHLPAGITVAYGGITSQLTAGFSGLLFALGAAVVLVYVLMALTFGSLVDPFILLFALPLAAIGAFPALLVTGRTLSISALIGLLMLVGIVVTNAIVLLDLVKQRERQGMTTRDALIAGGRTRVRPILMTAVATILATLPLAMTGQNGSFIAAELGTVVIGGLLSSTLLTLLVIPVLYSLVSGLKQRLGFRSPQHDDEEDEAATGHIPATGGFGARETATVHASQEI